MTPTRILVVEDESIIAMDIRMQLMRMGYEVPGVIASGEEAVTAAADIHPDLILMDINLQGKMDGIEAAQQIQSQSDIPIIYLTAFADELTLDRAKLSAPYGYVLKPFEERELHSTIQTALYRHHMQQQLRESEERYRSLFENAPNAIFILQEDKIQLANDSGARLLGTDSPALLQGQSLSDFIVEGLVSFATPAPADHAMVPEEITIRCRDGRLVYVERTLIDITYEDAPAVQIVARDVTVQHLAAAAEQVQRTLASALQETAAQLSHSLNLEEVLDAVLLHIETAVPYDAAAILMVEDDEIFFARLRSFTEHIVETPFLRSQRWPITDSPTLSQLRQTTKPISAAKPKQIKEPIDTTWIQSLVAAPLRSKGTLLGFLVLASANLDAYPEQLQLQIQAFADQAAIAVENAQLYRQVQQQAAELEQRVVSRTLELEQERRRFQAILDTAGEAIYLTDVAGRLEYANPATEAVTGYPAAVLQEHIQQLLFSSETPEPVQQELQQALAKGIAWHGKVINQRQDGTLYDAALSLNPIRTHDGSLEGFVHVLSDVTHLKELHRLKDQFASQIGHELRTPITNFKLYLELLQRRPENAPKYQHVLVRETSRLQKLVEGFIEMFALTAETAVARLLPVDLNAMIMEIALTVEKMAAGKPLSCHTELSPTLPPALADTEMISHAIDKLLDNALHYTPAGGVITINTAVRQKDEKPWVTLTIEDTGPGILPQERPYIFQQFYRGELAQAGNVPGAGLGLPICEAIIKKLNGQMTVNNLPNSGAAFTIWLRPASFTA